jgi:hypothetical protein
VTVNARTLVQLADLNQHMLRAKDEQLTPKRASPAMLAKEIAKGTSWKVAEVELALFDSRGGS